MDSEASQQRKQERSRTRWTAALDKIFADLVIQQIQLGNRQNNVFDKKTWNFVREEFNKQTYLNFNNNQLRKHLDILRQRYNILKSSHHQNEFVIEDSCLGLELWDDISGQVRPEPVKVKDCPIYDELCLIFADTSAEGKYAQSSHFEGLNDKSVGKYTSIGPDVETAFSGNPSASKKRKRSSETNSSSLGQTSMMDPEVVESMANAMFDMVGAYNLRMVGSDDRFSINKCIKVLDEIQNIDGGLYFAALDLFEKNMNMRETFISLKDDNVRLTWLQGKC